MLQGHAGCLILLIACLFLNNLFAFVSKLLKYAGAVIQEPVLYSKQVWRD